MGRGFGRDASDRSNRCSFTWGFASSFNAVVTSEDVFASEARPRTFSGSGAADRLEPQLCRAYERHRAGLASHSRRGEWKRSDVRELNRNT